MDSADTLLWYSVFSLLTYLLYFQSSDLQNKKKQECWMIHLEKKKVSKSCIRLQYSHKLCSDVSSVFHTLTTFIWCTKDHKSSFLVSFLLHLVFLKDASIVKFKEGENFVDREIYKVTIKSKFSSQKQTADLTT